MVMFALRFTADFIENLSQGGAFIPIVYGIVAAHGFANLLGANQGTLVALLEVPGLRRWRVATFGAELLSVLARVR